MADERTGWTARVERGSLSQSTAVNTISRKAAPALVQEDEGPPDRRVQILSGTPGSNRRPSPYGAVRAGHLDGNNQEERASAGGSSPIRPCAIGSGRKCRTTTARGSACWPRSWAVV